MSGTPKNGDKAAGPSDVKIDGTAAAADEGSMSGKLKRSVSALRKEHADSLQPTHSLDEVAHLARAHRYHHRHEPRLVDYQGRPCGCEAASLWYLIKSLAAITFRWTTLWVIALTMVATYLCYYFNIVTNMGVTILSIGIVFPLSFTISFEINRRERILLDVASLKASMMGLYFHAREWPPTAKAPVFAELMRQCIDDLLKEIAAYLSHKHSNIFGIYTKFDELNHICEDIRRSDEWVKSVASRLFQYVRYSMNDFERLRTVSDFHTPSTFRAYTWAWLTIGPILFSPYFASLAPTGGLWAALYNAFITSLMLVILYNASAQLEDPFDGDGPDDLNMEMIREPTFVMFRRTRHEVNEMRRLEKAQERADHHSARAKKSGFFSPEMRRHSESDDLPPVSADGKEITKHEAMEQEKALLRSAASADEDAKKEKDAKKIIKVDDKDSKDSKDSKEGKDGKEGKEKHPRRAASEDAKKKREAKKAKDEAKELERRKKMAEAAEAEGSDDSA